MKLDIHNFRCHENTEVEIPDNKITLLSGYSGQGKSTILESILFVLYDDVRKPFTFGKKKCKVVLSYKTFKITRQKGPNLLQVSSDDINLENDLAQQWIIEEFGTLQQFYCACYIRQMEKHFLFTQNTSQIMDFIHTVAFGRDEISHWKEKLQERKKEFDDNITKYDGRIQQQELIIQADSEMDGITKEEIEKLEKRSIEIREDEIRETQQELAEMRMKKDKKVELYHSHQIKKKQVHELKEQLDGYETYDMKDLEAELEAIMTKLRTPVSSIKQELKAVEQELNRIKKMIGPNTKVDQKLPVLIQEKQIYDKVNEILKGQDLQNLKIETQNLKQKLENLQDRRKKLEVSIQSIGWTKIVEVDCPSCHTHLFYTQNNLLTEVERPEKIEIPIPDASEKELGSVIQQIEYISPLVFDKENIIKQVEELTHNVKWTSDLDKKIENYTKCIELMKRKTELTQKSETDKNLDSDQIQELENSRQEIQKKMKQVHQFDVIKLHYDTEKTKLSLLDHVSQEDLAEMDKELNHIHHKIDDLKEQLRLLKKVIQYKKETEMLDHLYVEKRKWQLKSEACVFLKQKTLEAESLYLDELMEQINLEINSYLECIFDKSPMTLTFKTSKEIKSKKETKPSFAIDIFYKNEQYDSINQLSGGESAKCGIAILLAFNKILNSKIILLDESLNALDMESKLKVLDVIRNTGKSCILISHDEIQGIFDKVLTI